MPAGDPFQLTIDVAQAIRPLSGTVRAIGQPDRAFDGWTELFAAIDAAIPEPTATEAAMSRTDSAQGLG